MVKRVALIVLAFALMTAVIFTGCTPARRPYTPGQENNANYGNRTNFGSDYNNYTMGGDQLGIRDNGTGLYNTGLNDGRIGNSMGNYNGNNPAGYNGNTIGFGGNQAGGTQADTLARACEQVAGVENATVVVTGNTAYCGIDLDENTNLANERDIKNQVAQKIRATGNDINTVYVSAEADFMDRIRNVGSGLRNGRPVDAFTTELNEMVRRLSPTRW